LSEDNMSETEIDEIGHQLAALLANPAELHVLVFVVDVLGSILLIHFGRNLQNFKNDKYKFTKWIYDLLKLSRLRFLPVIFRQILIYLWMKLYLNI
jgi:hypothetical protein